jgi:hypothetical protein
MTTKRALSAISAALSVMSVVLFAGQASADETVSQPGSTMLKTTVVVGRNARPSAVVEISRAKPGIKLSDLQDPAVEKIIRAATKSPF